MTPPLSTKICRGCLSCNTHFLQPLFDNNMDELFRSVTSLDISEYDGLPQYVCVCCANRLFEYNNFKMQCLSSDVELKSRLSSVLTSENAPCVIDLTDNEDQLDKNDQMMSNNETEIPTATTKAIMLHCNNKLKELLERSPQPPSFHESLDNNSRPGKKKKTRTSRKTKFVNASPTPSSTSSSSIVSVDFNSDKQRKRNGNDKNINSECASADHMSKNTENPSSTITEEQNTNNAPSYNVLDWLNMWRPRVLLRRLHVEYDEEKQTHKGTFVCKKCEKSFTDEDEFDTHINQHEMKELILKSGIKMETELEICDFNSSQVEIYNVNDYSNDESENIIISSSDDNDDDDDDAKSRANLATSINNLLEKTKIEKMEQNQEPNNSNFSNVSNVINTQSDVANNISEKTSNNHPLVVIHDVSNYNQNESYKMRTPNAPPKKKRRKSISMVNSESFLDLIRKSNEIGNLEFRCRLCHEVFQHALTFANHYKSYHKNT